VTAALHGAGYWALVCLYLSNEFIQAILVIIAASWWPRLPKRGTGVRPLIRFGGLMMAFDLLGYLNYKFDNLVVGWFLGPAALGYYDRAYQFLLFPVNQVSAPLFGVAHASLSRLQSEPERYRRHLNHCLLLSAGFGMPLVGCLYANLESIIGQLLGPQWLPAAPVFRALAPAAFLMTITASVGWIFLSLGRAGRQIRWAGLTTVLTVMAFFMGLPWGTAGVALAFSISRIVLLVPTLIYTCKDSPVDWTRILLVAVRPASASLLSLGVSTAIEALYPASGMWSLVRGVSVYGATYCLSWMIMPGGRAILRENLTLTGGPYFTASN
jgi:O-antigen/teichoic acid export membrane protein